MNVFSLPIVLIVIALIGWPSTLCGQQAADTIQTDSIETEWGRIDFENESGILNLLINKPAARLSLPETIPNIVQARLGSLQWPGEPLGFSFNSDATEVTLVLPEDAIKETSVHAFLETAENSQQFHDGRIVFGALDAKVHGEQARLESHPGNHRIGFWTSASDFLSWNYKPTRTGKYKVRLSYSVAGNKDDEGSEIEVSIGDTSFKQNLKRTGSWYQYASVSLGEFSFVETEQIDITVKCLNMSGGAVMNFKALMLSPTCEGEPPLQADDGKLVLHSKDSTVQGVLLRWEPNPAKRTLGYWANEKDYAFWDFQITQGGTFDIQITQGCGLDQGGSTVEFQILKQNSTEAAQTFKHTVKDTGHWQAFEEMKLGTANLDQGKYRIQVKPIRKSKNAIMDLQKIILSPSK